MWVYLSVNIKVLILDSLNEEGQTLIIIEDRASKCQRSWTVEPQWNQEFYICRREEKRSKLKYAVKMWNTHTAEVYSKDGRDKKEGEKKEMRREELQSTNM